MTADEDDVRQFARARLAGFKVPKGVTFLLELPKTATGKVQKFVLRGGRAGIAAQYMSEQLLRELRELR